MRNILKAAALVFIWCCAASQVSAADTKITKKNFPDNFFQAYVKEEFDKNQDGILSDAEKKKVKNLDVGETSDYQLEYEYPAPYTLKGIENFTQITELDCSNCSLSRLDVSKCTKLKKLYCNKNTIKKLNLSRNKQLERLNCMNNKISSLDLKQNQKIIEIYCDSNKLKKVDVTANKQLKILSVSNNKIKKIEVGSLKNLVELYCDRNKIKKLNVSGNKKLVTLNCYENRLNKLDLKKNKNLDYLACSENRLSTLDLSNNRLLSYLFCENNQLVTGNVKLPHSQFSRADISPQKKTVKVKKIGKYYYIPLKGVNRTNVITDLSDGKITEKGIRLEGKEIPKKITYEYNMFTDGEEKTKVEIRVKK